MSTTEERQGGLEHGAKKAIRHCHHKMRACVRDLTLYGNDGDDTASACSMAEARLAAEVLELLTGRPKAEHYRSAATWLVRNDIKISKVPPFWEARLAVEVRD